MQKQLQSHSVASGLAGPPQKPRAQRSRRAAQIAVALIVMQWLAGCGQKGPLTLPVPVAAPAPPSSAAPASAAAASSVRPIR